MGSALTENVNPFLGGLPYSTRSARIQSIRDHDVFSKMEREEAVRLTGKSHGFQRAWAHILFGFIFLSLAQELSYGKTRR